MNLNKHREFFNPDALIDNIHIIGCGAVGSTIAEQLARLGCTKIHLYDFDIVKEHNITNQMFLPKHINKPKTTALKEMLLEINPTMKIIVHEEGWNETATLEGYVFLAVDSIEIRKQIINTNMCNTLIKAFFDTRMRLTDAQHYAALNTPSGKQFLLKTMNFTSEEAQAETPMSACGTTLNVTPTVRIICALAVSNFINATKNESIKKTVLLDAFKMTLDVFE